MLSFRCKSSGDIFHFHPYDVGLRIQQARETFFQLKCRQSGKVSFLNIFNIDLFNAGLRILNMTSNWNQRQGTTVKEHFSHN